jgi:hypothetical protein
MPDLRSASTSARPFTPDGSFKVMVASWVVRFFMVLDSF